MYRTVIFDLDGTLLDTIGDLAAAANAVCRENGWPEYTVQAVEGMVGHGIPNLVSRFSPAEAQEPQTLERTLAQFNRVYGAHNMELTAPYAGMPELLKKLKAAGVRLAVCSNKADEFTRELIRLNYGDEFDQVIGFGAGFQPKPDPGAALEIIRRTGVKPEQALYVGDSDVDIMTGHNAGISVCAALWGFRGYDELAAQNPTFFAHNAEELKKIILG